MLDVTLNVIDEPELADKAARRIVSDLSSVEGVAQVGLHRIEAEEGDKGVVDVIGAVIMTLASEAAVGALIEILKQMLVGRTGRRIKLKVGETEIEVQSDDLSDDEFDRLLTRLERLVAATRAS